MPDIIAPRVETNLNDRMQRCGLQVWADPCQNKLAPKLSYWNLKCMGIGIAELLIFLAILLTPVAVAVVMDLAILKMRGDDIDVVLEIISIDALGMFGGIGIPELLTFLAILLTPVAVAVVVVLAILKMRRSNTHQTPKTSHGSPESVKTEGNHREPSGIGGWLILVAIGLIITCPRLGVFLYQTYVPLFQDGTWETLTTPGSEQYHEFWAPLLIFELVGNLVFLVAYAVLVFLFFRESRFFPMAYISISLLNLCFVVLDAWFASFVLSDELMTEADTSKEIMRSLMSVAIWVPYMMVSKRVRNTFIR